MPKSSHLASPATRHPVTARAKRPVTPTPTASPAKAVAQPFLGTAGVPQGLDPAAAKGAGLAGLFGPPGTQPISMPGLVATPEELVRRSNFWRDNYNPLRGLTIARLLALFEQAERGAFSEVQLVLRKAEKRFPVLKGFIMKMLSSVEGLEAKVRLKEQLPDGATPEMAEAQRRFLQARYDLLQNFKSSLGQLVLAEIRGYAVLQKKRYDHGPSAGAVRELYWIEPWCLVRDGFYGDFYYNLNSQFGVGLGSCALTLGEANRLGGENLPREEFVIQEEASPLYEIALIAFVNWLMGRKDYAAFTEIFGLPNAIVVMPPNIPPGREAEYMVTAEKVAHGGSGAIPNGSDVKFPAAAVRGRWPFGEFCDAQEKDLVLAGTGGTLTMIAAPTGLGKGASEEHDEAWQKIALNKARRVNEVLQRDFDAVELAAAFPGQPVCVEFALQVQTREDIDDYTNHLAKLAALGYQPDEAELNARVGMKLTQATA